LRIKIPIIIIDATSIIGGRAAEGDNVGAGIPIDQLIKAFIHIQSQTG
jgi:hypothetical protein